LDTLAAAYAETGDFENAVKFQSQAIEPSAASADQQAGMRKRLELYRKKKHYREQDVRHVIFSVIAKPCRENITAYTHLVPRRRDCRSQLVHAGVRSDRR
jgi:hypothetical protein